MFVIVWGWAFPVLMFHDVVVPLYRGAIVMPVNGILRAALHEPGLARDFVTLIVIFLLIVISLLLPMKAFFLSRGTAVAASPTAKK